MSLYDGKKSDYFATARTGILDLMPIFSERVLEIGCGSGETLEMLKKKNLCVETVGIELFPAAADQARNKVDIIHCLDVEKSPMPGNLGKFNLILLLDVLEHLVNPWVFLSHLIKEHLAFGGKLVASIPNARHFSLIVPLLCGRFDYAERGILDITHLRFFTKASAASLLRSAGLNIEVTRPTSLDLHLNSGKLNAVTFGLLSGFLASQYIFRAAREK